MTKNFLDMIPHVRSVTSGAGTLDVVRTVKRITWIGFGVNAMLMVLKLVCGWMGNSEALVADGFHSMSDFATDLIVISFIGIAYRVADKEHPYGHGKFETLASLMVGVALLIVALSIFRSGVMSVIAYANGAHLPHPEMVTLVVAFLSIVTKEWLYRYTVVRGRRVNSPALIANAKHHRSDAVSSIATVIGIGAAILFGEGWQVLDPIVSILIAVFIAWSAVEISRPTLDELLERSLSDSDVEAISKIISETEGVRHFHRLRTRRVGHSAIVDVHIKVDPDITVTAGHEIATAVERRLRTIFSSDIISNIHIEPQKHLE